MGGWKYPKHNDRHNEIAVLDLYICKTESSKLSFNSHAQLQYIFTRVYIKLKCVFLSRLGISNTSLKHSK